VGVVAVANDRHGAIDRGLNLAAVGRRDYAALVELEHFVVRGNAGGNRPELDGNLELVGVVGKDVDEVSHLSLSLLLVVSASLRPARVGVVFFGHDGVLDGVLEGVGVETSVAAPGTVVAVNDLLHREGLHLAGLEEDVALDNINSDMGPGGGARGQLVLDSGDGAVLEPVDVVGNVLGVEAGVMVLHVMMVLQLTHDATAQELSSLVICPVGVGVVAEEVGIHLGVEFSDELLRLAELSHALVVLTEAVRVLVEQSCELHVLVVKDRDFLKFLTKGTGGNDCQSKSEFHF